MTAWGFQSSLLLHIGNPLFQVPDNLDGINGFKEEFVKWKQIRNGKLDKPNAAEIYWRIM